ncbi:MAG TPA: single-stranded DNA-binding protein [Candidatus Ornithoclostridium faecavium]|nr:single-stranded DNA-binding protein [Candidatus Ornithoclostridium faecavium]
MNKIILIGNLTRDPESGTTPSGVSYCRFSIAVNRRFSKENNEADYFNVITWRGIAESCAKSLSKGRKVGVVGSIQIRNYEGNDGAKRTSVEVTADEVEFLSSPSGSREDSPQQSRSSRSDVTKLEEVEPSDDNLPF